MVILDDMIDGFDQAEPSERGGIAGVAGLFQQFAGAGRERVLARFEQAAGGLQAVAARPGAELADEDNRRSGVRAMTFTASARWIT